MQIIGETKNGFIIEASEDEIKKIIDCYYNQDIILEIGNTLNVHQMYDNVKGLMSNYERIKNIEKEFMKIIKYTKKISPIMAPEYKKENE